MLRASLFVISLFVLGACGGAPACKTACDCPAMNAPIRCPGEWGCNLSNTCEYTCKNTCETGGVFTCGADDDCNGSICSARKACK